MKAIFQIFSKKKKKNYVITSFQIIEELFKNLIGIEMCQQRH